MNEKKKQIKLGTIEKRVEFIEMQTAEDISNIDKIYNILERIEKRLDRLDLDTDGENVKSVRLPHFEHEDR